MNTCFCTTSFLFSVKLCRQQLILKKESECDDYETRCDDVIGVTFGHLSMTDTVKKVMTKVHFTDLDSLKKRCVNSKLCLSEAIEVGGECYIIVGIGG